MNGREHETTTIAVDRLLDRPGGVLLVEGALGLGKSHLVRRASSQAAERGWQVVSVAGSSAAPAVPFAPWAHVLHEVPIDATPAALVAVALARLRGLRARSPVLVAIDDLDRLDELSLVMADHVLRSPDLAVVATMRPGAILPRGVLEAWRERDATTVELAPLDRDELGSLVAASGGPDLSAAALTTLWRATGGNPLFALELLRSGLAGTDPALTLTQVVRLRLADLPPDQLRLLELLAVGGSLDTRLVDQLVDDPAVRGAVRADLVEVSAGSSGCPRRLRLVHRFYAETLRARLGDAGVRRRLEELITASTTPEAAPGADPVQLEVWHAELGVAFDPATVGRAARELSWGFHDWLRRGLRGDGVDANPMSDADRVDTAYRLARLAWTGDPTWTTGLALLGALQNQRDRLDEFDPVFAELDRICASEQERATLTIVRALWLVWVARRWPEAESELQTWEGRLGEPYRQLVAYARGGFMVQRGDIGAGLAVLDAQRPPERFPAVVRVAWSSPWAAGCAMAGRLVEAIDTGDRYLPLALELGDEAMVAVSELVLSGLWARLYHGDLRDAEERALTMRELAGDLASAEGLALLTGVAARARLWQGEVQAAVDLLRQAVNVHEEPSTVGFRPLLHTTLAVALTSAGSAGAAEEVAEARRVWVPPRFYDADLAIAAARVAAADGRVSFGAQLADDAAADAADRGNHLFGLLAAHTAAAIAPDDRRLGRLAEIADEVEGPLAGLLGRRARITRVAAAGAELDDIADGFAALGANHEAGLAWAAAARAHRRAGDRTRAARSDGAAVRAAAACVGLAQPPTSTSPADRGLTRREQEVAALAAKDWSSPDIADELGVSVRTVESHLYRAYAKLGVSTRAELRSALEN